MVVGVANRNTELKPLPDIVDELYEEELYEEELLLQLLSLSLLKLSMLRPGQPK